MINRNAYTSLLESIQEATTAPKVKVAASTSSPVVRRQKDSMGAGKKSVQWGDPAIGGAMNATELAQFLNKQSEKASGTSQSTSTDDNVLGSRGNGSSAMRSSTSTPSAKSSGGSGKFSGGSGKSSGVSAPETGVSSSSAKKNAASLSGSKSGSGLPKKKFSKSSSRVSRETSGGSVGKFASTGRMSASRTVADSVEYALNAIVEENLMEWPLMINGILVHNATQLAGALNSNPSGSKAQGKISSAQGAPTPTGSRPKTRPNMSSSNRSISGKVSGTGSAPRAPKGPGPGASVMDSVEWDELDEILAEGIELYGEDTFAEILADFVDTGELSEELADLLDAAEQLDELSNKTYKSYSRKSTKDIKHRSFKGGLDASSVHPSGDFTVGSPDEDDERENRKVNRRIKGIGAASKALGRNAENAMKAAKDIKRKSIYRGFYRGED